MKFDPNSIVRSEQDLTVEAQVENSNIGASASTSAASIFYTSADAKASTVVNSIALVSAQAGAQLTGVAAFDAIAEHRNVGGLADADRSGGSAFGAPNADAYATRTSSRTSPQP